MSHPTDVYRSEFEARVLALNPKSILDVGFGGGALLRLAAEKGIQVTGVDIDEARVAAARDACLSVHYAAADALPFADMSFDCVVAELVAHHFSDLRKGLLEMLRVAHLGVFILDPWFDEAIPSQASAAALERWMKAVDRAKGGINNGPLIAEDFRNALPASAPVTLDIAQRLTLTPASVDEIVAEYETYLDEVEKTDAFRKELARLIANARRTGLTQEGAIFVSLKRV